MKLASAVLVLVGMSLTLVSPAKAQQLDLSTMTCDNFVKSDKDTMKLITTWMAGFYTEESDAPTIDLPKLNDLQDRLVKFCARETSFPIKTAAEGIYGH
jgi:acid stress chaperone HdeB